MCLLALKASKYHDFLVLAIAEQDPLVLVLRTRKRAVLVLDGSSSIASSRWSDTPNRDAAEHFPSSAFDSPFISKFQRRQVR
jgi:hypothetical protein